MPETFFSAPKKTWYFILSYILLVGLLRLFVFPSNLTQDVAELFYESQWLKPGYGIQPPFFTWVQYFLLKGGGMTFIPIVTFKILIIILIYWGILKIISFASANHNSAIIYCMLSLGLMVQLWYETFAVSHTLLVTFAAVWSVYVIIKTTEKPRWDKYLYLGLLLGIGFLSKYNFVLFVAALLIAGLSQENTRKTILSPLILLTILSALIITYPHLVWLFENLHNVKRGLQSRVDNHSINAGWQLNVSSPMSLIYILCSFAGLWVLTVLLFLRKEMRNWQKTAADTWQLFFQRFLVAALFVLIVSGLLWNVSYHERYLQPFLVFLPIYFFLMIRNALPPNQSTALWFKRICVTSFAIIFIGHFIEPVINPLLRKPSGWTIPYRATADSLKNKIRPSDIIMVDSKFLGGNLRFRMPDLQIVLYNDSFNGQEAINNPEFDSFFYVWHSKSREVPEMIKLNNFYRTGPEEIKPHFFEFDYTSPAREKYIIGIMRLPKK